MGVTPGLRQEPTHARGTSEGAVLSLPGRDGSNAASVPPRLRPGRKKSSQGAPPSTPSHTPRHPGVFALCCPSSGQTSSTRTLATSRPLGTPGPSFAPPSLVFSVRKGYIGAVTERLRVGAACGHHISAGNGGGRETSVDLPAPVSESLPDGTPD